MGVVSTESVYTLELFLDFPNAKIVSFLDEQLPNDFEAGS